MGSRFIVTGGADRRKDGPMRALNTVAKYNKFGLEEYINFAITSLCSVVMYLLYFVSCYSRTFNAADRAEFVNMK